MNEEVYHDSLRILSGKKMSVSMYHHIRQYSNNEGVDRSSDFSIIMNTS